MSRPTFANRRSRAPYWIGGLIIVVAIGAIGVWVILSGSDEAPSRPIDETRAWSTALTDGRYADIDALAKEPGAGDAVEQFMTSVDARVTDVRIVPPLLLTEDRAVARLGLTLDVADMGEWRYAVDLPWVRTEGGTWVVDFEPEVIHPDLTEDRTVRRVRSTGERAPLLDRDGEPLRSDDDVVEVAVQPSRMTDRAAVAAVLESELGISPDELDSKLGQPWVTPESRVPVAVVDSETYFAEYRDVLRPVPGLVFAEKTEPHLPTPEFAAQTIGRLGEVTAEQLDQADGRYEAGDVVGLSGLEAQYETTLAGQVDVTIELLEGDTVVGTLLSSDGTEPSPVTTTLSPAIQIAADATLKSVEKPAALVAIEPSSGEILAVTSTPTDGFHRALSGQYPPGSTFKVVTASALFGSGVTGDRIVPCPASIEVNGNTITNFEDQTLGDVPFSEVFVNSCNTGFIALGLEAGGKILTDGAESLGFNVDYDIGAPASGGVFPDPGGPTELAASSIGQAQVLASPLHMASVAAAAATGTWRSPLLIRDDSIERVAVEGAVPPEVRELMLEVVARGTGTNAAVEGLTVGGKTGTAEFGSGGELSTHAWFIGFAEGESIPGGIAFAVVVEDGGVGGRDAAPIAAEFLERVRDS